MIWKQRREIRREPTRNRGIHLVVSVSFFFFPLRPLMQFIRGGISSLSPFLFFSKFFRGSCIYINPSCRHRSASSSKMAANGAIIHLATDHRAASYVVA